MNNHELITPNQIIKSKRQTISLIIKNDGTFIVRAPLKSKDEEIFKFINQKSKWIINKRTERAKHAVEPLNFSNDEQLSLLGKSYYIIYDNIKKVKINETEIVIPNENSKEKLVSFLKNMAKKYILERTKLISSIFNFEFKSISISSAKTCWGSCSHDNRLHFTYKLIMCPEDVVDYIVLHELCHTKIKNHSNKFWALVEECNPNYKVSEKWLKQNRAVVDII